MKKRILPMLMALCLTAGMIPVTAFAEEESIENVSEGTTDTEDEKDVESAEGEAEQQPDEEVEEEIIEESNVVLLGSAPQESEPAVAAEEKTDSYVIYLGAASGDDADGHYYDDLAEGWEAAVDYSLENNTAVEVILLADWKAADGSFGDDEDAFHYGAICVPEDADIILDLNGYKIDRCLDINNNHGNVIYIEGKLTVNDSEGNDSNYEIPDLRDNIVKYTLTINTGLITGGYTYEDKYNANDDIQGGGGISVHSGTLILNGGTIAGNEAFDYEDNVKGGGGVYVYGDDKGEGIFIMNGGTISYNRVNDNGGGVFISGIDDDSECYATFTMNGDSIDNNFVYHYYGLGGGICSLYAEINLNNGSISGNKKQGNGGGGGGIAACTGTCLTIKDDFKVTENESDEKGGGIYAMCDDDGTTIVNMDGGIISNNEGGYGIGVYLADEGVVMNITGGEISGSSYSSLGGGIFIFEGTVNMSGGEISRNTTYINATGVNVYVAEAGVFNMSGGSIEGGEIYRENNNGEHNLSGKGAGIYVAGTFNMSGDEITDNMAQSGGGVYVTGTFTMSGGEISGNTASTASGVYVYENGIFNMSGGEISGNKANGTGVCNYGEFNMSGGKISGNTGGGVYVYKNGIFNMSGGEISGNIDDYERGGGVVLAHTITSNTEPTLIISGNPVVSGNIGGDKTSNIYLYDGQYITLAGELTDGASIGVTTFRTITETYYNPTKITEAEDETEYYKEAYKYFIPDAEDVSSRASTTGKYVEFYYDATAKNTLTFNLQGVSISGEQTVITSETSYTVDVAAETGYTLSDTFYTVYSTGNASASYTPSGDGSSGETLVISNIDNDAGITLKGTLKEPAVETDGAVTKTYDGNQVVLSVVPSHEATVDYSCQWYKGDDEITGATGSTYTLTGNVSDSGTYYCKVTATDTYGNTSNVVSGGIVVSITESQISGLSFKPYNGAYDGKEHTVEATIPDGVTVMYGTEEGTYNLSTAPTYTNAGTYKVYYEATANSSGVKIDGSFTITITAAVQSISFADSSVQKDVRDGAFTNELTKTTAYGDVTYSSSDMFVATVDETGKVTIVGEGTATITATAAADNSGNNNYNAASVSYTLTVTGGSSSDDSGSDSGNSGSGSSSSSSSSSHSGGSYSLSQGSSGSASSSGSSSSGASSGGTDTTQNVFTDLSTSHPYYDAIMEAYEKGYMVGVSANEFAADEHLTRAMAAQILWNKAGNPEPIDVAPFLDVTSDEWYAKAIAWAYEQGLIVGYDYISFGPNDYVTTEQFNIMLAKFNDEVVPNYVGGAANATRGWVANKIVNE